VTPSIHITDPNGNAQIFTYDGRDRVATITNASDSSVTSFEYEEGEISRITAPNSVVTDFVYEATYGRLDKICDKDCAANPAPNYIKFSYDGQGNRTELSYYNSQDTRRYRKQFSYQHPNNPGKLWKQINPDATFSEYLYDAAGNINSITDAAGKLGGTFF
jgi:YD repeat-containing protein